MELICWVNKISKKLEESYGGNKTAAQNNAWIVLEQVLEKSKEKLITEKAVITREESDNLLEFIEKITKEKMPIQYLTEKTEFLGLDLEMKKAVFIPRVETEGWCQKAILELRNISEQKKLKVLDLCTGSGCIALSIAKALKSSEVFGVDLNINAVKLSQKNATLNGIENCKFLVSDLYEKIEPNNSFDFIVANPPYISRKKESKVDAQVKKWEDNRALFAGNNGLEIIEIIIAKAPKFLKKNTGQLWCEIDIDQSSKVKDLFKMAGFSKVGIIKDIYDNIRVVIGKL